MTYEELKAEASRYCFGPDHEVVVEQVWDYTGKKSVASRQFARLGFEHHVRDSSDPDKRTSIFNLEAVELKAMWAQGIQDILQQRYMTFCRHEMEEWARRDGRYLHDPHGVRGRGVMAGLREQNLQGDKP